ncbi:hypothetical protein JMK10_01225 [Rhodovulum sulfidophilum]|uniref:hypothetical protein n=1 Tax=Rhodovulum sulfidophilum TaxID=35806 RepID=UPI0019248450|nr:hypothetical protein [Rhodovulum sulfidophilum]MBL3575183.1 hypothetical protein [Rhodovulum sulfidophilum]MCE8431514.1 hypothetical protein [Rhodovulum sulfidophilum]MCF4115476.1 hypothetical protein [Rhodovulum sulfidophilum]
MPARRGVPDHATEPRITHLGRKGEDSIRTNEWTSFRVLLCSDCQVFALRLRGVIGGMRDETGPVREALHHDPAKRGRNDLMPMPAGCTGDRRKTVGALSRKTGVTPGDLDSARGFGRGRKRAG